MHQINDKEFLDAQIYTAVCLVIAVPKVLGPMVTIIYSFHKPPEMFGPRGSSFPMRARFSCRELRKSESSCLRRWNGLAETGGAKMSASANAQATGSRKVVDLNPWLWRSLRQPASGPGLPTSGWRSLGTPYLSGAVKHCS